LSLENWVTLKLVIFPFLIGIISSIPCSLSACVRLLLFSEDDFLLLVDSAVGAWSAHWLSGMTCCYKFMCMGEGSPFQKFCFLIELMWHVKQDCIHCGCDVRLLLPTIWRFKVVVMDHTYFWVNHTLQPYHLWKKMTLELEVNCSHMTQMKGILFAAVSLYLDCTKEENPVLMYFYDLGEWYGDCPAFVLLSLFSMLRVLIPRLKFVK